MDDLSSHINSTLMYYNLSNTSLSTDFKPYSERLETYLVPIVFAFIFVVGVLGNGTLVLIFINHKSMRNVPNIYILSLALGDLLVILTCVPFTSTVYTFESWPYGESICKISESTKDISVGVSVFTLTALSADRFFAIVDPLRKLHSGIGGKRATRCTILIVAAIWIFAILCAIPSMTLSYVRAFKDDTNNNTLFESCYPFPPIDGYPNYPRTVIIMRFLIYYAVPLLIIACFYSLMARSLILSTKNMPGELQGQTRQIRARKKVAKTVLTFVVVFAMCFFPQHFFFLWFYINPTAPDDYNDFWHILRIVGFCLGFINSCINPIALYCVSGTFRKYFQKYLFCKMSSKIINSRNANARRFHRPSTYSSTRKWDSVSTTHNPNNLQMNTFRRAPQNDPVTMATEITKITNGDQIIM
ncbi:neuropeptide CCHamide-1 receptor-like [Diaphorina citri]|uniref:Neuropeptide CCHamide-1 receptor-like n=1 Tax=Diaphorina citri TaxID=121845 RepID=A0A1S3DS75_DIACI|nr:neuropeptide CCHamide-1 receptor-like [Diaphorina citri]